MTPRNPARGEVEFAVGEDTYRLRFGVPALMAVEEAMDAVYPHHRHAALKVLVDFLNGAAVSDVPERVLAVLLLEGLREFQPKITRAEVLAIREVAGISACVKAIQAAAFASSLELKPVDDEPEAEGEPPTADPPTPPAG